MSKCLCVDFLNRFYLFGFRSDCLNDKSKFKKWNLVSFGKKPKLRGIMEGAPLTQEGICQVYQLIEFLKNEQSNS